jgi:hypothetical protein
MLNQWQDATEQVAFQETTLSVDAVARFACSTWDEAVNIGQSRAAATPGSNPEKNMFAQIPDFDQLGVIKAGQSQDWIVIILRGIGEMRRIGRSRHPMDQRILHETG